ncbi:nicotinate-nicotinamide nucleotide adenylyltransferase, partial [Brachyspira sp. SAP_772]
MKIAILGGSFDPPHLGHLILADTIQHELKCDKILFIPSKIPPHKSISGKVSDDDRINMLKLSIEDNDNFILDDYEIKNDCVSYTIKTLEYIYNNYKFED